MIVESYEDVIVLSGALRANQWDTIHTAISLTLQRYPTGVIIDCSGLQECTRGGAETFQSALNFIADHHARIIVAAVSKPVMTVLNDVPDVRSRLPIAPTVEAARQSMNLLGEHVNIEDEGPKKKKRAFSKITGKVIVLVTGRSADQYAAQVAAEFATIFKSELALVYPVLVPRELPLSAPLPEEESIACGVLNTLEDWCKEEEIPVSRKVVRAREMSSAVDEAEEVAENAHLIVVGLPTGEDEAEAALKTVKLMMARSMSRLIFVRDHK